MGVPVALCLYLIRVHIHILSHSCYSLQSTKRWRVYSLQSTVYSLQSIVRAGCWLTVWFDLKYSSVKLVDQRIMRLLYLKLEDNF